MVQNDFAETTVGLKTARYILQNLKITNHYGVPFQQGSGLELVVGTDLAYHPIS